MNQGGDVSEALDIRWLEEVVGRLIGALAPQPVASADSSQTLVNDLGYDSLLLVQLSFALEDLFVVVPVGPEDAPPIGAVREVQDYILAKARAGQAVVPTAEAVEECLRQASDGVGS